MFIELVEFLRCVRPHDFTWLVAGTTEIEHRDIRRGVLGCPGCGAEYPIENGVADFTEGANTESSLVAADQVPDESTVEERALRAAALLDLGGAGGFAALTGEWSHCIPALRQLTREVQLLLINPATTLESGDGISILRVNGDIPLKRGSCRGVALDAAHGSERELAAAEQALRARGRLVAPAHAPVPDGVQELARDELHWVGVKEAASSEPLPLTRARSRRS